MNQENIRVYEKQQNIRDLLESPNTVNSGLLAPQEIRKEFNQKEEI